MFSVLFPGQGSQSIGMIKELYDNFEYVKKMFNEADEVLKKPLSRIIFEGPKDILDLTENTQPAIFLASFSIFSVSKRETDFNLNEAKFFAGHSLGEYSALAASEVISFEQTLKLLNIRGKAMQSAVPKGEGGMLAVLGAEIDNINQIIDHNKNNFSCYVANDNSLGQVVISGKLKDLDMFSEELKKHKIKNIILPVSAPFHCKLMKPATEIMERELSLTEFNNPKNEIFSNVNALSTNDPTEIKKLLIKQIENPVRWREIVVNMIKSKVTKFIEIGPGKVLSGLVKRIDRNVNIVQLNSINDIKNLKND
tara:strand:+ start:1084 stop:2013 length:930 start_codon:yes stop_codon:yes gene_type:complete